MRQIVIGLSLVLSLTLGGCLETTSVLTGGTSFVAPINNPVSRNQLAAVENAYGIVLTAAVHYKRLPLCHTGQTASVSNLCAQRSVILQLQSANAKTHAAIVAARNFVRRNPTLSAISAIGAAENALADFKTVAANNGVQ